MKLTDAELIALPPKARRDPEVVDFYRKNEYLTAYALHTDKRVRTEGHETAAGADASRGNWDSHGDLQRDFLIHRGLQPHHKLLDVGCGGGRLARKVVPYLEVANYHGVDISAAALEAAKQLAKAEGWIDHHPQFWLRHVHAKPFDFIWAHSVFTHLPPDMIEDLMRDLAALMTPNSLFFWTYVPTTETARYGLTQFKTAQTVLESCATQAGLTFEEIPDWVRSAGYEPGRWSYEQSMAMSRRT